MHRLLIALATAATLTAPAAHGQTCRINCGTNAAGCVTFKDVYEYGFVDCKPTFPGGDCQLLKFINKHRQYPKAAYKAGVQGRVVCSFVVNTDGSVGHVSVLRGVEASLDAEAVRLIKAMPDWEPGRHGGQPVAVRVIHTIPFRK